MSLKIIREGIFDTIQDTGRWNYLHLGINPNGCMDPFSAQLANALLGKELNLPVVELHFPASSILFEQSTVIVITGGDFSATINNETIPLYHPFFVPAGSHLEFTALVSGAWCYIATLHDFNIDSWLGSFSTNTRIGAGGFKGRKLKLNDRIDFKPNNFKFKGKALINLHWQAKNITDLKRQELEFIKGNEWNRLTNDAVDILQKTFFALSNQSDRMGYRLEGNKLETKNSEQLVSAPVCAGTMQLLPNGQLIVLMADHQTTGGYPRIGYITSASLPLLAQQKRGSFVKFKLVTLADAEEKNLEMIHHLEDLQLSCNYKMQNFTNAYL